MPFLQKKKEILCPEISKKRFTKEDHRGEHDYGRVLQKRENTIKKENEEEEDWILGLGDKLNDCADGQS